MIDIRSIYANVKTEAARAGYDKALQRTLYFAVNRIFFLRRFDVIYLPRVHLKPLDPARCARHVSRIATEQDLVAMRAEGTWDITDGLLESFRQGDTCLLSHIDGKLAGYTWVHVAGRPRLIPGLRISIPSDYLYNYAGFTHPDFRGRGLQPIRHHAILGRPEWSGKKGMIGYVEAVNWSSKKGQTKSGYERLGSLTMFGTKTGFSVLVSSELRKLGIRRLHD